MHNYRSICAAATLWRDGQDCTLCPDRSSVHSVQHACYRSSRLATVPLAIATRGRGSADPVLNRAAALIVLNEAAEHRYRSLRPKARIELIPNFAPPVAQTGPDVRRSGWLYVGRLTEEKGILWLRDHWPEGPLLTIVGSGPLEDEVKAMAANSPQRFAFAGRLPQESVLKLLRNVHGLVLPSLWSEGLPTVILEALSVGAPVVVSTACAAADQLVHQGAGTAFDPGSPESLASALRAVASDQTAQAQAELAYEAHYSPQAWLARMEPLMADVANAS